MKLIAYAIWIGLGTCVFLVIILTLYAKLRPNKKRADASSLRPTQPDKPVLSEKRWGQLVAMLHLHDCPFPANAAGRVAWAHSRLGIEKSWLQGFDSAMYPHLSFHNAVEKGVDFIQSLKQNHTKIALYIVKPSGVPLTEDIMDAGAVLCFATPAAGAGCSAQCFYPVNVYWEWGYPPERVQCSQIIYAAIQAADIEIKGVEVKQAEMYDLLEGKSIPQVLVQNIDSSWDPNSIAIPGEELTAVQKGMISVPDLKSKMAELGWS